MIQFKKIMMGKLLGGSLISPALLLFNVTTTTAFEGYEQETVPTQEQQSLRLSPINWQATEQQEKAGSDQPKPLPPSDLPSAPDPEPEPYANVPGSEMPPSVLPEPAKPGLPMPPMPDPAAPHLAPPPPPMPQPADPPPLSHRPDLNPANPGTSDQSPTNQAEPIAY